ncbi:MAG: sigma 54-interacting transcriptional regulator [Candidatus Krumholzibacteriota bacterium]|nr:sigma 54-interacting transcriptional regulator [Candidatus Krumholzibacteriota bacterium]
MYRVPTDLEGQYDRFLKGRGDIASSLVLRLREKGFAGSVSGAWTALLLSRIYTVKGRLSLASSYLKLSRDLFRARDHRIIPLGLWINKAILLRMQGEYLNAAHLLRRIHVLSIKNGTSLIAAKAALNLSVTLARLSDLKTAERYLEYASLNYSVLEDARGVVRVEIARAFIESMTQRRRFAIDRLEDQLSIRSNDALIREKICGQLLMTEILLEDGEYEKAEVVLQEIKGSFEILDCLIPMKIRWFNLKAILEASTGRIESSRRFRNEGRVKSDVTGIVDPLADSKNIIAHGRSMNSNISWYGNRPLVEGVSNSVKEGYEVAGLNIGPDRPIDPGTRIEFISKNIRIDSILNNIRRYSPLHVPILLEGESGTGKEIVARLIHHWSGRGKYPFIPVNSAAIPEDLFEAELFGHSRGAFTGAVRERKGIIAVADKGTVFLDEIGELAPRVQSKLLRLLENGEYMCIGDPKVRFNHARVIAATNKDLARLTDNGEMRNDFYYRMSASSFKLPALRERGDDIFLLSEYFLNKYSDQLKIGPFELSDPLKELLRNYSWPGNVRELKNELLSASIRREKGKIRISDLSSRLIRSISEERTRFAVRPEAGMTEEGSKSIFMPAEKVTGILDLRIQEIEKKEIFDALDFAGGNKSKAAKILGLKRTTFLYRLKRHGFDLQ